MKRILIGALITGFASIAVAAEDVTINQTQANSLVIDFSPLNWQIEQSIANGVTYTHVKFQQAESYFSPGEPDVPARRIMVGVPLSGNVTWQITTTEAGNKISGRMLPVVETGLSRPYTEQEEIYQSNLAFPKARVEVSKPMWYRDQRIVFVTLYPLSFSPTEQTIQLWNRITVQLQFQGSNLQKSEKSLKLKYEPDYQSTIANYEQAKKWRRVENKSARKQSVQKSSDNWYKISIQEEGMYKLTGKFLSDNDISIQSIDPATVKIYNNGGRELPRELDTPRPQSLIENAIQFVDVNNDGKLDNSDYFLFYGKAVDGWQWDGHFSHYINHYTKNNIYWLTWGDDPGKRMQTVALDSSIPAVDIQSTWGHVYSEQELENPLDSGIDWYGVALTAGSTSSKTKTYGFTLNSAIEHDSLTVVARVVTAAGGDHGFQFLMNNHVLGSISVSGIRGSSYIYLKEGLFEQTTTYLVNGYNQFKINYNPPEISSKSYVDWVELHYKRHLNADDNAIVFYSPAEQGTYRYHLGNFTKSAIHAYDLTSFSDVRTFNVSTLFEGSFTISDTTNAHHPKHYLAIADDQFLTSMEIEKDVVADLRNIQTPADFIIITHDDFYEQALALESLRENCDDLQTTVVKISDVYDDFSWGLFDPVAIRDFVKFAYENWGNPGYVLLIGTGDYDYRNILDPVDNNWIPPYQSDDMYEVDSRARDDYYVCVSGDDDIMDLAIGRLPVRNPDQARIAVRKIIDYHNTPAPGDWRNSITMVADDVHGEYADVYEPEHTTDTEQIINRVIPESFNINKIYLIDYPEVYTASITGIRKPAAQAAILDAINKGTLVINYIGHGRYDLWAHEVVLDMKTDLDKIQNGNKLALWVAATCYFGRFDNPDYESMSEELVIKPDGGAIAVYASARLAQSGPNAALTELFYEKLFPTAYHTVRIGDAVKNAKNARGNYLNDQKTHLFGDPTIILANPKLKASIKRIAPDSIEALKQLTVSGEILKDGVVWPDFNGEVLVNVFDSQKKRVYSYQNDQYKIRYTLPGNSIFRGQATINKGQFQVKFIVPKDITYGGDDGRISVFFDDAINAGTGFYDNIGVGGTDTSLVDIVGPEIHLAANEQSLFDGAIIEGNQILKIELSDSISGINIAGAIGHNITVTVDGRKQDITDTFKYNPDSYTTGHAEYQLENLSEGLHHLSVKAWDNSNNSSEQSIQFTLVPAGQLSLQRVLNYPNPIFNETDFTFLANRSCEVTIKIYTVAGRLIRVLDANWAEAGFNRIHWDGRDEDGDELANGVYLYKVKAKSDNANSPATAETVQKLMIMR
ncbi:type IX secretion system sortase PorU [candidate division KSB1 bacterium]|nr:type IX secretion system sortase PorU [candidate division KSB1 bacterium]